jgi:thymidylate kinase
LALFCFLASALGYFAALLLFGHELSLWLYRGQYTDHSHLLFWAGLLPVTGAISTVLGSALRSLERPDRVFWCNAAATLVTVTVGVWLLATQGLDGVILGAFIASATGAVVIVVVYTRTFASFRRDSAGAGIVDSPKLAVAHLAGAALVPLPFGLTENTFAEPTAIDSETRRPAQRSTANFMWAAFAERLDRAGIRYCVLHGWQTLPDSLPSDLDLIVERRDLAKFESLLHEEPDWQPVQVIQYEHSGYYFVLAHRRHGGHVLIDAAFDYRRNGRILFTADELLAGRTRWGAFWVAAPRVEFIYLLTKKILKGNIPEAQKGRLRELAAVLGDAAQSAVQRLLGPEWEDDLLCWLKQGDWANFAAKLPELKHAVTRQSARRFRFNGLRYRLAELARGWRRVRYPTGFMVVVLGPDGAGKSTLNEGLSRDLSGVFRRSQGYHLRPGLLGRKKDTGPVTNPHGKPVYSPWLSMLKVAFYSLDCCAGYWLKLRPKLIQSALVHFDRYYEDLLVDPRRYCYAGPAGFVRFARRWVPQPDLFLILDVLQERLLARKQEVTPEEVGRQQRAYVELARRLPNAVLIDGSQSPEVVIRQAKAVILERLHERYRARRPLWFAPEEDEAVAWARSVLRAGAPENGAGTGVSVAGEGGRTNANERIFNSIKLRDGREYWIPTGSSRQRSAALELYRPNTVKGRLAKSVAALALKAGFIENFAPSTALVERGGASGASLFDHIERILCQANLTFAIYLGTPGPQRKPVIQAIDPTGRPIAYVKVGWDEFTSRLVENENRVIELLNGCGFRHGQLPRVLHFARWNERTLLVTEPMQLQSFGNARQLADDLILKFLLEVAAGPQDRAVFSRSALFNSLKTRLSELKKTLTPHKHQPLQSAIELLETSLGSVALPWFWRLGDFTPWNLGIDYTGAKVQVIDLEYAGGAALPGWDLFHFWAQTNFARAHGRRRDAFAAYFRAVEVDERFVPLLDLCYRLDLFTERAKAWEESGQRRSARAVGDFNDGLRSIQELTHRIRTGGAYVHRVI